MPKLRNEEQLRLAVAAQQTRPDLKGLDEQQRMAAQIRWVAEWQGRSLPLGGDRAQWWEQSKTQHSKLLKAARHSTSLFKRPAESYAVAAVPGSFPPAAGAAACLTQPTAETAIATTAIP